ncbi:hypothetical protein BU26DRAFT_517514 [Trematosphaeria pertusa]|uniref:Uncharacterized protein n=1 Tax=Trematosphaeria pertusa TaxID=390896 RepID=A0A6A6IMJ4_9PLEO|nr:uncharacterized protein BU26DRAFT_517514 [Trematosphaeria pertusa]KAF2250703.1 hypothetical protein BU26DRAFT_517514 [Trematosphaeria pertusa]
MPQIDNGAQLSHILNQLLHSPISLFRTAVSVSLPILVSAAELGVVIGLVLASFKLRPGGLCCSLLSFHEGLQLPSGFRSVRMPSIYPPPECRDV